MARAAAPLHHPADRHSSRQAERRPAPASAAMRLYQGLVPEGGEPGTYEPPVRAGLRRVERRAPAKQAPRSRFHGVGKAVERRTGHRPTQQAHPNLRLRHTPGEQEPEAEEPEASARGFYKAVMNM